MLRLTSLTNFTGVGLTPLRGSGIVEKIDLSLVGEHESPVLDPEPPISCDAVLSVLDNNWRGERSETFTFSKKMA